MHKKRNAVMAVLAVALVAALTIGGTLAYMTDSASLTNTFKVGDLDIDFKEPDYPGGECIDRVPGDSLPKNPTVKSLKGDSYMRVKVEFLDEAGNVITDAARLALIQQVIYYDKNFSSTVVGGYKGSSNLRVWNGSASTHTPDSTYHYTQAALAAMVAAGTLDNWYNKADFVLDATRSTAGTYYLNYNADSTKIFYEGQSAVLFTSIVFPSDWNQTHLNVIGNFSIRMTAQAIQAAGFANIDEALAKLDGEISAGTLLVDYTARP